MRLSGWLLLLGVLVGACRSPAESPAGAAAVAMLTERCGQCHGAQQQMGGLRLDSREAALRGGASGAVVEPGESSASRLYRVVAGLDDKLSMPPVGPRLTPEELDLVRAWIDGGAPWPETAPAANVSQHWSFTPVVRPDVPEVERAEWVRNPIDAFVLARLEEEGVQPAPPAERAVLARRVSLDLTGLPPAPARVDELLADNRPDAYERFVDELLESPHYGERWAIPWLDLARYADSDGYEKDRVRPFAWRYRDWVIRSLNDDKPFDRFTIEQIAGDLLPDATQETRIATGFHRNTLKNREGGVKLEQFRFEETIDRANTVSVVWMGLTVGCAQCHDHKYDPISQRDYYRFFAFFNNLDEVDIEAPQPGELGPYLAALPEYRERRRELLEEYHVVELQPAWEEQMRQAADNPGRWTDWDHAYDALQKYLDGGERILRKPVAERSQREADDLTDHFVINYHRVIPKDRWKELDWRTLRDKLEALRAEFPDVSLAQAVVESELNRETHLHVRGAWQDCAEEVQPAAPSALPPMQTDRRPTRLDLARWLVRPDHPLTARVTVNRIWQLYFGRGLVGTPDDFGSRGEKPSHPELLDWLAADFMENGWKLKRLHKLIVTSATYRQASTARPELMERDPDNRLLARQQRLRLPAELIRDSALAASGLLDPHVGGPSVRPPQPEGVAALAYANSVSWEESAGGDGYRRGLYTHFQRATPYPQMLNFDASERSVTVCQRERSNTPLQALNLLNDPVFVEAARGLAYRTLSAPAASDRARLERMFRDALVRAPAPGELADLESYLGRQTAIYLKDQAAAQRMMPVAIGEVPAAEVAAWTAAASVLLNLDEFITRE